MNAGLFVIGCYEDGVFQGLAVRITGTVSTFNTVVKARDQMHEMLMPKGTTFAILELKAVNGFGMERT